MSYKSAPIDINANGDNTILAAVAGAFFRVVNFVLIPSATVNVQFFDGASAGNVKLTGVMNLTTQGLWPGWAPTLGAGFLWPHFDNSVGNTLVIKLSAGTQVGGYINYFQIAV